MLRQTHHSSLWMLVELTGEREKKTDDVVPVGYMSVSCALGPRYYKFYTDIQPRGWLRLSQ